jgi:hypothetical protein
VSEETRPPTAVPPAADSPPTPVETPDETTDLLPQTVQPLDVQPPEVEPDVPWPGSPGLPAALAVDFHDGADGIVLRAGSLRGRTHVMLAEPRQDAYAYLLADGVLHIAVADGVGSQTLSHLGAALAARLVVELSQQWADAGSIGPAVAQALTTEAATHGHDPLLYSTTLCWMRIRIGTAAENWLFDAAEWGDSELLAYDTRALQNGHPDWRRLPKPNEATLNSAAALPVHTRPTVAHSDLVWQPGQVLGLFSDGIAADIRHDTVLGHALARAWHTPPSPWEFIGQIAFRYRPANDDRTAVVLWRPGPDTAQ